MNDENSEGELRVLQEGASKLKKDGLRDLLVCVGIFQNLRRLRHRSKLDKGRANRRPRALRLSAVRCFVSKNEGKYGGGARHEVELSTRVLLCCPCFGEIVTVAGLAEERDSERTREKTRAFSRMMSTSATQCAATLQGKRPLRKGTDVYQEQENFWSDWKLHNIIDLLSSGKVGFRTDGSEMSAAFWSRKGASQSLAEVLCETVLAERRRRLEDQGTHIPESHSSVMSSRFYHGPSRHKHGCLHQPSRSGIWLLFPSIFYVCCRNAKLYHSVAKKNINSLPGRHCLQAFEFGCGCSLNAKRQNGNKVYQMLHHAKYCKFRIFCAHVIFVYFARGGFRTKIKCMRKVQSKSENLKWSATARKLHAYKRFESPGYENSVRTKYSGFTVAS